MKCPSSHVGTNNDPETTLQMNQPSELYYCSWKRHRERGEQKHGDALLSPLSVKQETRLLEACPTGLRSTCWAILRPSKAPGTAQGGRGDRKGETPRGRVGPPRDTACVMGRLVCLRIKRGTLRDDETARPGPTINASSPFFVRFPICFRVWSGPGQGSFRQHTKHIDVALITHILEVRQGRERTR